VGSNTEAYSGAKANTLFAEFIHQLRAHNARRKPRKILHCSRVSILEYSDSDRRHSIRSRCELASGRESIGHESLEQDRVQIRAREIDGSGVSCRPRANYDLERIGASLGRLDALTYDFGVHFRALFDGHGRMMLVLETELDQEGSG
jgi:hypothetical protein